MGRARLRNGDGRADRRDRITPTQWAVLRDDWWPGAAHVPEGVDPAEEFAWGAGGVPTLRQAWALARDEVLREWTREWPGTRPRCWWAYDSRSRHRRRTGGTGTPLHEALPGHSQCYERGVPLVFVDAWTRDYYSGRARGVDGELIEASVRDFGGREFRHEAYDPADPPRYESEAVFLERVGELTPPERRMWDAGELDTDDELIADVPEDAGDDDGDGPPEPWRA